MGWSRDAPSASHHCPERFEILKKKFFGRLLLLLVNVPSLLQGSSLLVHLRGVHQGQLHLLVEVLVEVLMREQLVIEVNDKIYMWSAIWYT